MKTRTAWSLLLSLLLGAARLSAEALYTVTDLGMLGGGELSALLSTMQDR